MYYTFVSQKLSMYVTMCYTLTTALPRETNLV